VGRPAEAAGSYGSGFLVYATLAGVLFLFSVIAGFGIGLFIMPIPLAMIVGLLLWRSKPTVAGLLGAAAGWSGTYVLTVPGWRFERSSVGIGPADASAGLSGCRSMLLPAVPLERCDEATAQALVFAFAVGALMGGLAAIGAWAIERRLRASKPTRA
jgi:hypothetical protein